MRKYACFYAFFYNVLIDDMEVMAGWQYSLVLNYAMQDKRVLRSLFLNYDLTTTSRCHLIVEYIGSWHEIANVQIYFFFEGVNE